jgi:hypothetical protein
LLAFDASRLTLISLEATAAGKWQEVHSHDGVRLCANYTGHDICNWTVPADSADSLCQSCSLTRTIPELSVPGNKDAWNKLETAKRRLLFDLLSLRLPMTSRLRDPDKGLEFNFLGDVLGPSGDQRRVLTGHDNGAITINVAEADDVHREAQRQQNHEPYRTLLGHFRHEIGHYFWDRLIGNSQRLQSFRQLFGDERLDYQEALKRHYFSGAPGNWADTHISTYATSHPWEDWAETWAHMLQMVDALDTAHEIGLSVRPSRMDEPVLEIPKKSVPARIANVDQLVSEWYSLTYVLNNLTRGLGLPDAYPFVLSAPVIEKLRYVCESIAG